VAQWAPPPADDATNPALAGPVPALWPLSPAGSRYEAVREAAELVGHARAGLVQAGMLADGGVMADGGLTGVAAAAATGESLSDKDWPLVQAWERDTTILFAEREERRGDAAAAVALPGRLSVSS